MWMIFVIPLLGIVALLYGLLTGAIVVPASFLWIGGAVALLGLLFAIATRGHKSKDDLESEYHTKAQAEVEGRVSDIYRQMMKPRPTTIFEQIQASTPKPVQRPQPARREVSGPVAGGYLSSKDAADLYKER